MFLIIQSENQYKSAPNKWEYFLMWKRKRRLYRKVLFFNVSVLFRGVLIRRRALPGMCLSRTASVTYGKWREMNLTVGKMWTHCSVPLDTVKLKKKWIKTAEGRRKRKIKPHCKCAGLLLGNVPLCIAVERSQCYCGKFDRCLNSLSVFFARKHIIGFAIHYVSLNVVGKRYFTSKPNNICLYNTTYSN